MRSKSILTAAIFAAFFITGSAMAETGTYMSTSAGAWSTPSNWKVDTNNDGTYDVPSATVKPTAINHVIIAHNIDVTGNEAADSLDVQASKILDIQTGNTLTLDGTSRTAHTIAGTVRLAGSGSTFAFTSASQSLSGDGKIEGQDNAARITIADTYDLTSNIDVVGSLQIRGLDTSDPPDAGFENNDVVEANRATDANDNKLVLYSGLITGSGEWKMATADAFLNFASGIKADATTAPKLTGPFTVSNGTLEIDENVTTTGSLSFSGGKIQVASGKTFITANN